MATFSYQPMGSSHTPKQSPLFLKGKTEPLTMLPWSRPTAKFEDDHRYSPSEVLDVTAYKCCGNPDLDKACTSHIERQNLTIRMQNRRMTRLTNAFSKKWDNHRYAMALHFATYNFVTPHGTLAKKAEGHKTTAAMESGLTDHPWTLEELIFEAAKLTLA